MSKLAKVCLDKYVRLAAVYEQTGDPVLVLHLRGDRYSIGTAFSPVVNYYITDGESVCEFGREDFKESEIVVEGIDGDFHRVILTGFAHHYLSDWLREEDCVDLAEEVQREEGR